MDIVEIIGYAASVLVALSLTMSKILRLRIVNLIGSITFTIYGLLLGAYPIFLVNSFIVCINIYYLIKIFSHRDIFDIIKLNHNDDYLERFVSHYKNDIIKFFPEFDLKKLRDYNAIFILRNLRPVNLVLFNEQNNGIIEILLDYTITEYRDFLNGKYLLTIFENDEKDYTQLVVKNTSKEHGKYLDKIGFKINNWGLYVKKI